MIFFDIFLSDIINKVKEVTKSLDFEDLLVVDVTVCLIIRDTYSMRWVFNNLVVWILWSY